MDVIAGTPSRRPETARKPLGSRSSFSSGFGPGSSWLRGLAWALLVLCSASSVWASSAAPNGPVAHLIQRDGRAQLEARLVRSHGEPRRVGVLFDLAPGWHVYWRSSGDTGLPPELSFEVPGATVGPIEWPLPEAFDGGGSEPGAASYGYEGRVLLAATLQGPADAQRTSPLAVEGDVLVCEYECVPAVFRLERAAAELVPGLTPEAEDSLFASFAKRVPVPASRYGLEISGAFSQSVIRPGDRFEGAIGIRSCTGDAVCNVHAADRTHEPRDVFLPDDRETASFRALGVTQDPADPHLQWVEFEGHADPDESLDFDRLSGVVSLRDEAGRERPVEFDVPFPAAPADAAVTLLGRHWIGAAPVELSPSSLLRALAFALLGGLILNLMPCVLPVLAIKVFSISQMAEAARTDRSEPIRHGIAYTLGILVSMAALGACVVLLRTAGRSVGWGFQFQEPVYVAAISAVLVAFALNLFGSYEINGGAGRLAALGQEATGARRSFFEGLLAVALATPCSAPFLGTAVGFAFASSPAVILAIFVAIGLGLAAPFLLVALVPSWARFMPRSGAWMQVVRAGLGFALLATVLWLLWIFGGSAGADGVVALLGFLLALSFALWGFGQLQRAAHPRMTLAAGAAVVLLAAGGLNAVGARVASETGVLHSPGAADSAADEGSLRWQPWSPETVATHLAAGTPVFVRFTADWCITCKVNERVALRDGAVREAFERAGVALLVGDWTHRDEAIRSELSRHGRAGVPLYLFYRPGGGNAPELLPELLTPDRVLAALATGGDRDGGDGELSKPASTRILKTPASVSR